MFVCLCTGLCLALGSAMSRRLVNAVVKNVSHNESGRLVLLRFFSRCADEVQEAYAELLEDAVNYRTILTEHRIGEFQSSQKEKVKKTAALVGLQVPKLYQEEHEEGIEKD